MTFEREERVAFARIISDLIEADFIVEEDEMESFDKIKDEKDFKITIDMLSEAKTKTFAEAVSTDIIVMLLTSSTRCFLMKFLFLIR